MVKGLDIFEKYFREYEDQYVLIIEALTPEFVNQFWQFVSDADYRHLFFL